MRFMSNSPFGRSPERGEKAHAMMQDADAAEILQVAASWLEGRQYEHNLQRKSRLE